MKMFISSLTMIVAVSTLIGHEAFAERPDSNRPYSKFVQNRIHRHRNPGNISVIEKPRPGTDVTTEDGGIQERPDPNRIPDLVGKVSIRSFTARRAGGQFQTFGVISNTTGQDAVVTYTVSKGVFRRWTKLHGSTVTVPRKQLYNVDWRIPETEKGATFKFTITSSNPSTTDSKGASVPGLPAKKFIVSYSSNGWMLVRDDREDQNPDKLIGQAAKAHAGNLNGLGFQTEMRIIKGDGIFNTTNRIMLYARALEMQRREFDTKEAANTFIRDVRRLTRNLQPGTNGAPLTFVSFTIREE